ncbi:MAG: hypothetical protein V4712_16795 [Pseudomonadota bacterium]|jgi:hypothetical protein
MAEINDSTLVIVIQALEAEMKRFRAKPDADLVPGDEIFYDDMARAASDLKHAYVQSMKADPDLPPYAQLMGRRG